MTFAAKMVKSSPIDSVAKEFTETHAGFGVLTFCRDRAWLMRGKMAVMPTEPFGWLAHFRRQMDEVFHYFATLKGQEGIGEYESIPAVDIYETPDNFVVEIELPGFVREEITLRFCYNTLFVEGIKREEDKAEELNYICLERHFGRFCRAIELPPAVDMAGARARYAKGLLSVVFPRLTDKKMVIREIPIE